MKIKLTPKLNVDRLLGFLAVINYFDISLITGTSSNVIHLILSFICIVYGFIRWKKHIKEDLLVFSILILITTEIILSTYLNKNNEYIKASILSFAKIMGTYFACMGISRAVPDNFYKGGAIATGLLIVFNDALMILNPSQYYGRNDSFYIGTFLLGNKFNVAYTHFFFLLFELLFLNKKRIHRVTTLILISIITAICAYVKCSSMIVGLIFLAMLILLPNKIRKIASGRFTMILYGASALFVPLFSYITQIGFVRNLVVNVLHKDLTFTGRANIYIILYGLIRKRFLFGYGYASTIIEKTTFNGYVGYGNAQNAFFDIFINYGLIGIILYTLLLYTVVSKFKSDIKYYDQRYWILISSLFVIILIGTVEITYRELFILNIIMINAYRNAAVRKKNAVSGV